jgi:hypothetical protein
MQRFQLKPLIIKLRIDQSIQSYDSFWMLESVEAEEYIEKQTG